MTNEYAIRLLENLPDVDEIGDMEYVALQLAIHALMVVPKEEIYERLKNKIVKEQNNGI